VNITDRTVLKLFMLPVLLWPMTNTAEDFPAPPKATLEEVAGSVTSMGMNLNIRRFQTDDGVERVLDFYRARWGDEASESIMSPWNMIGKIVGEQYFNVQVQAAGNGSWGYLSISDLPGKLMEKSYAFPDGGNFPRMSGSTVMDDQISKDPGKDGRTLLISNTFSVKSNHDYYRSHYQNNGWRIVMDEQTEPRQAAYAMYMTKGADSVTLTIHRQGGQTMIVANQVKRGLLK